MTTHASGRQTIDLRTATEQDIEALVALVSFHGLNPARLRRRFETDLSEDESHVVVAMAGGELVGYGRCAWFTHPPQTPTNVAPEGYYMGGLLVETSSRQRGIGEALTRARMQWVFEHAPEAWYFTHARNLASLALHAKLGFIEVTRDFVYPRVSFDGGVGVLGRALRPTDSPY
jgi:ribosomal protein S18 acetylase RimI-like enzyme